MGCPWVEGWKIEPLTTWGPSSSNGTFAESDLSLSRKTRTLKRKQKMLNDFKAFIMRGNVVDLAVGVVIGVAFGAIVTSLVNDVVMPPIGMLLGQVDFKELFLSLNGQTYSTLAAAKAAAAPVIAYGLFLNTVTNFVIVSAVIFLVIRALSKLQKPVEAAAPATKECEFCCSAIPIKATRCPHCTSEVWSSRTTTA